jgi:hypothetical protein
MGAGGYHHHQRMGYERLSRGAENHGLLAVDFWRQQPAPSPSSLRTSTTKPYALSVLLTV